MALNQEDADRMRERFSQDLANYLMAKLYAGEIRRDLFVSIVDCKWSWQYKLRHNAPGEEW